MVALTFPRRIFTRFIRPTRRNTVQMYLKNSTVFSRPIGLVNHLVTIKLLEVSHVAITPPNDGFVRLPKELWNIIMDEFKQQVYDYNKNLPNNPTTQRQANVQELDIIDEYQRDSADTHPLDTYDEPTDSPLMAMVTEQSQLTPDDIRHILSVNKSHVKQPSKPPIKHIIKAHVTYTFAKSNTSSHLQLVDRGANGGLAGADMKVLCKSDRKVNICGIDDHELTGLDVVQCASLYDTNKGRVIGIFNEYAYYGKGRSIHSPAQMEWFKGNVDDKSHAVGGKQRLLTLEGYVLPFEVITGLVYMKPLGIPTDADLELYPHVILTDPHQWDPSVIDFKYNTREEWEILGNEDDDEFFEPRFDAYGDSTKRVIANLEYLLEAPPPLLPPKQDDSTASDPTFASAKTSSTFHHDWGPTQQGIHQHLVTEKEPNWDDLRPHFGYQPVEAIKKTFQVTTRHGCEGTNTHMRKHFKSRNPALNVHRRNEPVATDFIFSNTPAVDNGSTIASL